ncbi:unnamed protein product [Heligmosomoides polygyrus]|uniref:Secreted protein n=1 Tax=Heligmosomoides polygyrus TaxID=6339 RepID=A0A183G012_HELPZ|nr:unnamed protein product [Heligmosomoides polygyrus]
MLGIRVSGHALAPSEVVSAAALSAFALSWCWRPNRVVLSLSATCQSSVVIMPLSVAFPPRSIVHRLKRALLRRPERDVLYT